jgi:UDP-N-acetylglucosamine/UDP-N-acetylgalactosamine diphosphorylase
MKQWLLAEKRPNGNGDVLKRFYQSGLFEKWKELGVEYIQIILIDNPLAEPFDPNQIGLHYKSGAEVSLKAIEKAHADEKVGVIGNVDGKIQIVEYTENPPKDWNLANTSLFCFSIDFVDKVKGLHLPTHQVKKVINGTAVYKTETFIFDLLPYAEKVEVILYDRNSTFAPLKEPSDVGPVQRALLDRE